MPMLNETSFEAPTAANQQAPREFDILDVLLILATWKRLIFLASVVGLAFGLGSAFLISPSYTAKAVILPPEQQQSSSSALLGQFGALASITGVGSSLGLKNPSDLYIGILQSQSVADGMIQRFDLMRRRHPKRKSDLRASLTKASKFVAGKDGMISISVTDHDPRMAADMANAYVDELYHINNRLAFGPASQRRLFFEQQLAQEKDKLADAEVALKKTSETTGVIAPSGQTETVIRQVAQLEAEITAHEVELDALRTSSTEQNPEVIRLTSELTGLRAQLRDVENGSGERTPGDISITTANVPQAGLEYIRKEREVKYHQLLFDLLARQYEAARLDEAKSAPVIQMVDTAQVPDRKSAPFRALWGVLGGMLGFFLSAGYVLSSHAYHRLAADEEQGRRLALLSQELKLRN